MITILAVGKKHESWIQDGVKRYEKRLHTPFDVKWCVISHSSLEGDRARQEESERILSRLRTDDYVVLLDETGKMIDSPTLSRQLEQQFNIGKPLTIIIGGAYGVDERLKQRANMMWSLSPLVFPHQLVRLILIEQLYRAQTIAFGVSYHHQ